jgi:hypothetical protein
MSYESKQPSSVRNKRQSFVYFNIHAPVVGTGPLRKRLARMSDPAASSHFVDEPMRFLEG